MNDAAGFCTISLIEMYPIFMLKSRYERIHDASKTMTLLKIVCCGIFFEKIFGIFPYRWIQTCIDF